MVVDNSVLIPDHFNTRAGDQDVIFSVVCKVLGKVVNEVTKTAVLVDW